MERERERERERGGEKPKLKPRSKPRERKMRNYIYDDLEEGRFEVSIY